VNIIVYYRTRPSELSQSERALAEQHESVQSWLANRTTSVIKEYAEAEGGESDRPQLRRAIEACRLTGATLLIARTEAIGAGKPFLPRITTVPVIVVPQPDRPIGYSRPASVVAPCGLSLHFDANAGSAGQPVYVCNRTGVTLEDVTIRISATTAHEFEDVEVKPDGSRHLVSKQYDMPTQRIMVQRLAAGSEALITDYDPMIDGDLFLLFDVSYRDAAGLEQRSRAGVGTSGPDGPYVEFRASE
jgi:hypothetical protein